MTRNQAISQARQRSAQLGRPMYVTKFCTDGECEWEVRGAADADRLARGVHRVIEVDEDGIVEDDA